MRSLILLPLALVFAAPLPAGEPKKDAPRPVTFKLDNGLTVILRPVAGAKDTALVVLYDIGGDHDPEGRSGLAHLVEHLYATAAAGETPARSFEELVKRYPRGQNFQTGDRYTVCAVVFPAKEVERELKEAAARMGDLKPTADDLARELSRIELELRNMFGGIPTLGAMNLAREKVRPTPRGGKRGGVMDHLKAIQLEEVQQRWRDLYGPQNAILVLAGDFDVAATRKAVEQHFGKLAAGKKAPTPADPGKPALGKAEEVGVKAFKDAEPALCIGFAAPPPASDQYPAFLVAYGLLRLHCGKLHASNSFPLWFEPLDDGVLIRITVYPGKGESAKDVLTLWAAVVKAAAEGDVEAGRKRLELDLARLLDLKDIPEASWQYGLYGLAFSLGRRHQLGIDSGKLRKAVAAVTADDVRRVLREVFAEDKAAAVLVRPQ
jgi:zinc protease